ncbi:MAG: SHOCT domain-containing protein [Actinomycetia bacterium]|jgi:hypothetical protein|nr:SHOCT domain-containing protein [Actinomycetes bacterium]
MDLGDFLWSLVVIFFMVMYFMIMFRIIIDLFRSDDVGGFAKAIWLIAIIFLPLITMLIYVIVRGKGMAERDMKQMADYKAQQDAYIKQVAGSGGGASAAEQIAKAQELLSSGAISQEEFNALKAKALA